MAVSESIARALKALNETLVEADTLARTLNEAGGDEPPSWVGTFWRQVERISDANEELQVLMNREALPRLRDMDAVHGVSGS